MNSFAILWVAAGGALGSVLRFGSTELVRSLWPQSVALGTLIVNIVGALVAGALFAAWLDVGPEKEVQRLFLLVGLLGGFTTFSAFSLETFNMLRHGYWGLAVFNSCISVAGTLLACAFGFFLVTKFR